MRQHERRREARVTARGVRARVRPGHTLVVVDVSSGGALVEASCQLRPGSRIEVHLENDDRRQMVGANVTRCSVAAIDATVGITYRAALCFMERLDWVRETTTPGGYEMPDEHTSKSARGSK
jgi:hypothetical protein